MASATGTFSTSSSTAPKKKRRAPKKDKKAPQARASARKVTDHVSLEIAGLIVTVFSLLLFLSLISFTVEDFGSRAEGTEIGNWIGPVGAYLGLIVSSAIGVASFALNALLCALGVSALMGKKVDVSRRTLGLALTLMISGCVLIHMGWTGERFLGSPMGGLIGAYVGEGMRMLLSTIGTVLVASTIFVIAVALLTGRSLRELTETSIGLIRSRLPKWEFGRDEESEEAIADGQATVARKGLVSKEEIVPLPESREILISSGERKFTNQPPEEPEEEPKESIRDEATDVEGKALRGDGPKDTKPQVVAVEVDLDGAQPTTEEEAIIDEKTLVNEGTQVDVLPPIKNEPKTKVAPLKIVESDAMRKARSGAEMVSGSQKSLPLDGLERPYELPALSILNYEAPNNERVSRDVLLENAAVLQQKLEDFGVKGSVVEIHPGPVVTMYEFKPAAGIKISRIANLSDDLSMALAALRVRIVAPIPGKSVVGIEVPNQAREVVYLKEILSDDSFQSSKMKVPIAIGKDIVGFPVVEDMAKMPHLLVAGSTGSGKSVAINSFICSVLYRSTPEEVKMIMVDPKMLELSPYEGIPHLLLPVVTDPQKAALALKWAVAEMERRYKLMAETGVRNISGYNTRVERLRAEIEAEEQAMKKGSPRSIVVGDDEEEQEIHEESAKEFELPEKLPFIVIIIDELADLMMVASKDVETSIARLAQMARAAGLHLIIATQRPSVDVITGLIKANFPSRMSFRVSSKIDSRTILDGSGAENLLGMGDMLFMPPGSSKVRRIHGCFVSDTEVEEIVSHLKTQGKPDYCMEILAGEDGEEVGIEEIEYDEYYDQAVAIVAETRQASISYLQRRLKIGYNRAARIVDIMEKEGVIGPQKSTGRREVLIDPI